MPQYQYVCPFCGDLHTIQKPIAEMDREEQCSCGTIMERKLSVPAIIFKGSGFYSTSQRKV